MASASKKTQDGKGSGRRRRHRGRTVGADGSPRSHQSKGTIKADAGFSSGDTAMKAVQSNNNLLGRFKVPAPSKRWHRRGIIRNATTGEQVR